MVICCVDVDRAGAPVNVGVVVVQPCTSEDEVEVADIGGDWRNFSLPLANGKGDREQRFAATPSGTVCEQDVFDARLLVWEALLLSNGGGDEIPAGT